MWKNNNQTASEHKTKSTYPWLWAVPGHRASTWRTGPSPLVWVTLCLTLPLSWILSSHLPLEQFILCFYVDLLIGCKQTPVHFFAASKAGEQFVACLGICRAGQFCLSLRLLGERTLDGRQLNPWQIATIIITCLSICLVLPEFSNKQVMTFLNTSNSCCHPFLPGHLSIFPKGDCQKLQTRCHLTSRSSLPYLYLVQLER